MSAIPTTPPPLGAEIERAIDAFSSAVMSAMSDEWNTDAVNARRMAESRAALREAILAAQWHHAEFCMCEQCRAQRLANNPPAEPAPPPPSEPVCGACGGTRVVPFQLYPGAPTHYDNGEPVESVPCPTCAKEPGR